MSTRSGSSFAALLMSGPLAAIPLMAMFGVPQFSTVSASTDDELNGILRRPQAVLAQPEFPSDAEDLTSQSPSTEFEDTTPAFAFRDERDDPPQTMTPVDSPGSLHSSSPNSSWVPVNEPPVGFISEFATSPSYSTTASTQTLPQARPTPTTLTTTSSSQTSTWENAAQKLQELGIDDYRLERGQNGDTFLFICQFTPGADTRIVRRFEAEAADPAAAVQKVLQRISKWQASSATR